MQPILMVALGSVDFKNVLLLSITLGAQGVNDCCI